MSICKILSVLSACTGIIAGGFFAYGTVSISAEDIVRITKTLVDSNRELALSFAAQQAEYRVGALFLLVTFVLQVGAIVTSPESHQSRTLPTRRALMWIVGSVVIAVGIALVLRSTFYASVYQLLGPGK